MFFSFDEQDGNVLICGDERFFIFRCADSSPFVTSAKCPHRGGPLYMGRYDDDEARLYCPWHNYSWALRTLQKRALLAFVIGTCWTIKLPDQANVDNVIVMPNPSQESPEHSRHLCALK